MTREPDKNGPEVSDARKAYIADLFCGAGGTSTGAERALTEMGKEMVLVAINHSPEAIATHQANHPSARHIVEDVSIVDPETVVQEGHLDLLLASPECTHHSRARGGKPIHNQNRMAPWAIFNWLTRLDVTAVLIENVPEFKSWGPIDENGHAIKEKKGEYFQAWFMTFANLGYQAEWRVLNAADYGDATTRSRFFLMARKDGIPIRWPEPTHAKQDGTLMPGRKPWRSAREIIDWSNPGLSILDEPRYKRKPLVSNTLRRIAKGLERFGGPLAPLYIRLLDIPGYPIPNVEPFLDRDGHVEAFILNRHGENGTPRSHPVSQPTPTSTTRGAGYLISPGADHVLFANRNGNAPRDLDQPIPPATTAHGGGIAIAQAQPEPFLLGQQSGGAPRHADQPVPTIVASSGKISLIKPTIILYYGNSSAQSVDHPLTAITAKGGKHAIICPDVIECHPQQDQFHDASDSAILSLSHGNGPEGDKGNDRRVRSVDEPLPTITVKPGIAFASPDLVHPVPLPTPYIVPNFGEHEGQEPRTHDVSQPLPALTSHGAGNLITPELHQAIMQSAAEANIDPRRIVIINGQPYMLDIKYRMLQNDELARATSFDGYEFVGNKTAITKQIGNAVPVRTATALVMAALNPVLPEAAAE